MRLYKYMASVLIILLAGCSSLVLKPADFAWPVESVLKINVNGYVKVPRYSTSFNVIPLYFNEKGDSSAYKNQQIHVIRGRSGYYFMTGDDFRNVYVFNAEEGALHLYNKITVSDSAGMMGPAFNQRKDYIELVTGNKKLDLGPDGIYKGGQQK